MIDILHLLIITYLLKNEYIAELTLWWCRTELIVEDSGNRFDLVKLYPISNCCSVRSKCLGSSKFKIFINDVGIEGSVLGELAVIIYVIRLHCSYYYCLKYYYLLFNYCQFIYSNHSPLFYPSHPYTSLRL